MIIWKAKRLVLSRICFCGIYFHFIMLSEYNLLESNPNLTVNKLLFRVQVVA